MKINLLALVLFIFGLVGSSAAQSSEDLQAKYGKAFEAFYVRPNILMTVEYKIDRQILEVIIEPRHTQKNTDGKTISEISESEISSETATKIIDELVPVSERGKRVNGITFNSSCASLASEIYEKVEIYKTFTCSKIDKNSQIISVVRIHWKR